VTERDRDRMPLPSEDSGDLVEPPPSGLSDDPIVATEEGVPYTPSTDRVMSEPRAGAGGVDVAGSPPDGAGILAADRSIEAPTGEQPRDDALLAEVLAALRDSDVLAGDRIEVAVTGRTVRIRGEVESVEIGEEIAGIAGDVPGVDEAVDETSVPGL
jgi:hypothetical protein